MMAVTSHRWTISLARYFTGFFLRYGHPIAYEIGGRWKNRIERSYLCRWKEQGVIQGLRKLNEEYGPVFTGAYMIVAGGNTKGCKIPNICECISNVWKERKRLVQLCLDDCRLQALCEELKQFPYLGGFMSYEIACDLRYTYLLEDASDVDTWCNPGPGAKRGLNRLLGQPIGSGIPQEVWDKQTKRLLAKLRRKYPKMPRFEMREIEHSLCEYDKYDRMLFNEGHAKRRYDGCN